MERWTNEQYKEYLTKSNNKNKYHNNKIIFNGFLFDSEAEAKQYAELLFLEKSGIISELKRQVKFNLIPKTETEREVNFIIDFTFIENGKKVAADKKSKITKKLKDYIIKRKLFKIKYQDWEFREVL
jgi:hypothetical protein